MRFSELAILTEAPSSYYLGMFRDVLSSASPKVKDDVTKYITWARTTLKKDDRIIWFLRWARVELFGSMKHTDADAELERLNKRFKTHYSYGDMVPVNNLMTNLTHFLSMSIPQIEATVWNTQSPRELLDQFKREEDDWKEANKEKNVIRYQEGSEPEKIMEFNDGYAWFDLEKHYCSTEARAMGHCGNQGGDSSHTVLSLRKLTKSANGETYWYPVLTFIFDPDSGLLGEMKGRGNDKPAARYHPYIIALLKDYEPITGIKGGGYKPENNFKMADLDDEDREELQELKPGLADLDTLYSREGMTPRVLDMVIERLPYGLDSISYDKANKRFQLEHWTDFESFLSSIGDDVIQSVLEVALGETDAANLYEDNVNEAFLKVVEELPIQWQEKFVQRAGMQDLYDLHDAALKLMNANDEYFQLFLSVHGEGSAITEEAWHRLFEYAQQGWSFAGTYVYTNIPTRNETEFTNFVATKQDVYLWCDESEIVNYASADSDDDNDYGYELLRMQGDSGGRADWETVDWDYTNERRKEEGLVEHEGWKTVDVWIKTLNKDASYIVQDYINELEGNPVAGRINDPRQQEMKFNVESIKRLLALAGLTRL